MKKLVITIVAALALSRGWSNPIPFLYEGWSDDGYGQVRLSDNSLASSGYLVRIGNFTNGVDASLGSIGGGGLTAAELASMNAGFEDFLTFAIGDDGGLGNGNFFVATSGNGGSRSNLEGSSFSLEDAYFLVYNVNTLGQVDSATEFGLLQIADFPDASVLFPSSHSFVLDGAASATAFGGLGSFSGQDFVMTAVVIPEPGTWVAMVATVLGLAFWRARRKR